jgi:hypothetical protein
MRIFRSNRIVLAACATLFTQAAPAAEIPGTWKAQWIAPADDGPARDEGVWSFRKSLDLSRVTAPFLVDVSADTRFELHVNGKRVGSGPALGDLHHWHYETYDLSGYLREGQNLIVAMVWNNGTLSALSHMSSRTGFLLSAEDAANAVIDTGNSWQVRHETGRSVAPPKGRGYYAAGPPETMDGRKMDWSWDSPEGDQSGWVPARALGRAAVRGAQDSPTPWMLVKDQLPPMTYTPISAGRVIRVSGLAGAAPTSLEEPLVIPPQSEVTILLDRSALTTAYPSLETSGGRDSAITLTYAEALYGADGKKGNRNETEGRHIEGLSDQIVADGGRRTYRTLWWRTWRYLQVEVRTGETPLTIERLEGFYSAYPFSAAGHFESDDPELARIWETGWRTVQLCAHETYMDTPYWEQLQYIGDTRIQALISYAVAGDDRLPRQALEAFHNSLMPDGLTQSRYPSSLTQIIPPFSLLWIGMLDDFWQYRDDPAFVASLVPGTRGVLDWFSARQRPDGLLGRVEWWPFVDWSPGFVDGVPPQDADGGSAALTLQFIETLRYGAALEDRFGEKDRAARYRQSERRASEALMRLNWDDTAQLVADTPAGHRFSQQANSLAVWLDVIPKARQRAVMEKVLAASEAGAGGRVAMSQASYYFRFYLARAMVHAGLGGLYVPQLEPWRRMLQLGLSTWAETPEQTRSDSHAWSAHPTFDLLTIVAGIGPGSPGFGSVAIAPHLGNLQHVAASMPTPHGPVEVSYEKLNGTWTAHITLPENLSGNLNWHDRMLPLHGGVQTLKLE